MGTESSNAVEDLEAGCASTLVDDDSQSFACLSGQNDLNAVPVEGKQCSFASKHHDLQSQSSIPTTLDDGKIVECDAIVSGCRPVSSTDQKSFLLIDNNEDRPAKKQKVYQSDRVAVISGLTFRLKAKTTTVICEDTGVCMRQAGYGSMDLSIVKHVNGNVNSPACVLVTLWPITTICVPDVIIQWQKRAVNDQLNKLLTIIKRKKAEVHLHAERWHSKPSIVHVNLV